MDYSEKATKEVDACLKQVQYRYITNVRKDAIQVCSILPTLAPKIGTLTYDTGKQSTLMFLTGTIPMYFNSVKYNIPMNIWFVEMYPYHPPLAYVTPTANMLIKQKHKHVDSAGRCYLPYLANWNPQQFNIYELANQLSAVFAADPPVYQKPQTTPTMPPPPMYSTLPLQQQPQPTQPPPQQFNPFGIPQPQQPPNYGVKQPSAYPTYGMMSASMPPTSSQPSITPEMKRQNLIQQVTSAVKAKLVPVQQETDKKIQEHMEAQEKLKTRSKELQGHEQRLQQKTIEMEKKLEEIANNDKIVQRFIEENESKEVDVDKIITPEDVHSAQILDNTAEVDAIEDILDALDRLLQKKKLDLETYLKYTRDLAKEQFMKKALLRKINMIHKK